MSNPISEDPYIAASVNSACVKRIHKELLAKKKQRLQVYPFLRNIMFSYCWGNSSEPRYHLQVPSSKQPVGKVFHGRRLHRKDPVHQYTYVFLGDGSFCEAINFVASPKEVLLYHNGNKLGCLIEQKLPSSEGWWEKLKSFIWSERVWHVFLHESRIGKIVLNYPLDIKSQLFLELKDSVALPIGITRIYGLHGTEFVIPPNTPTISNKDLELLHFLINIVFRTHFLRFDCQDSGAS